ncbi:hypothetical protein CANCADRAFT_139845 [Tortispora caseinolytica NRRL Y-17796]|uniref:Uncharacterized protein n=1 Tax=Tortispora caseinolytica NRRL Y-17796 TaxID=767744 RepID=A0A1E4TCI0_9ASCO|nr:hypothetical protein CANCADRAFT_139845 [Tortispora caseinolytica NRRL Y-17796]
METTNPVPAIESRTGCICAIGVNYNDDIALIYPEDDAGAPALKGLLATQRTTASLAQKLKLGELQTVMIKTDSEMIVGKCSRGAESLAIGSTANALLAAEQLKKLTDQAVL